MSIQSEATGQLAALPFSNIIGGPLDAAVKAQAAAAKSSVEFIQSVAFDENGNVKNVVFQYQKDDSVAYLTVPVLTIVPVPYLRIDDLNISFKAKIDATSTTNDGSTSSTSGSTRGRGSVGWGPWSASMNASLSSKKDSSSSRSSRYSVEYTMDVNVHATQDDIPAGMGRVLSILEKSIESSDRLPSPPQYRLIFVPETGAGANKAKVKVTVVKMVRDDDGNDVPAADTTSVKGQLLLNDGDVTSGIDDAGTKEKTSTTSNGSVTFEFVGTSGDQIHFKATVGAGTSADFHVDIE